MTTPKKPTDTGINLKQLSSLADWLQGTGLEEVEVESHGTRIRLRKPHSGQSMPQHFPAAAAALPQTAAAEPKAETANAFKSPMVGTFYAAASPDAQPFVKEGDKVKSGQVLGIIEAMKTMNQIESDRAGTVTKVLVTNAQAVEYGQPLFIIQ